MSDVPTANMDILATRAATAFTPCFKTGSGGCQHVDDDSCQDDCEWRRSIARAIIAERERCAAIAERYGGDDVDDFVDTDRRDIAAAIRSPS